MATDSQLGNIFLSGIFTKYDTVKIVESLVELRRQTVITPLQNKKNELQTQLNEFKNNFRSRVLDLQTATKNLSTSSNFNVFTAALTNLSSSENPYGILSASPTSSATPGNYDIISKQTSQAFKIGTKTVTDSGSDTIGTLFGIVDGDTLEINGKTLNLSSNWTMAQLKDQINSLGANVQSYVRDVNGQSQIVISSNATGEDTTIFSVSGTGAGATKLGIQGGSDFFTSFDSVLSKAYTNFYSSDTSALNGLSPALPQAEQVKITDSSGKSFATSFDFTTMSLQDVANKINDMAKANASTATAAVEFVSGSGYRLVISNAQALPDENTDGKKYLNLLTLGRNALLSVDGILKTSSTNSFTNAVSGVNLTVIKSSADTVRLSVQRDTSRIQTYVQNFVNAYNSLVDYIKSQKKYDSEKKTAGTLSRNTTLTLTSADVSSVVTSIVEMKIYDPNAINTGLYEIGVTIGDDGKLSLDANVLSNAIQSNFERVTRIFTAPNVPKVSSQLFDSDTTSLNLSGEILVGQKSIIINTTDTLQDVMNKINNSGAGVRAYIRDATTTVGGVPTLKKQLILVTESLGEVFDLADVSGNVLQQLGLTNGNLRAKNILTAFSSQSDRFTSDTTAIQALLGLTNAPIGTVTITPTSGSAFDVNLDLSTNTLQDIATAINNAATAAGANTLASVVTETVNGNTVYRLKIENVLNYQDSNHTFETLGVMAQGRNVVNEKNRSGIALQMENLLANYTAATTGVLDRSEKIYSDNISDMDKRISAAEDAIEKYRTDLYLKWAKAEQIITKLNSVLQFLSIYQSTVFSSTQFGSSSTNK